MKSLSSRSGILLRTLTAILSVLFFHGILFSQDDSQETPARKPIMKISVAGWDAFFAEVEALGRLGDDPSLAASVEAWLEFPESMQQIIQILDKDRPVGVTTWLEGESDYQYGILLPTKNAGAVIRAISSEASEVTIEKRDNGVTFLHVGWEDVYLKEVKDYVVVASKEWLLEEVPEEPITLLEGLNERYTLGTKIYLGNLDKRMKREVARGILMWAGTVPYYSLGEEEDENAGDDEVDRGEEKSKERKMRDAEVNFVKNQLDACHFFEAGYVFDRESSEWKGGLRIELYENTPQVKMLARNRNTKSLFGGMTAVDGMFGLSVTALLDEETRKFAGVYLNALNDSPELLEDYQKFPERDDRPNKLPLIAILHLLRDVADHETAEIGLAADAEIGNINAVFVAKVKNGKSPADLLSRTWGFISRTYTLPPDSLKMNAAEEAGFRLHEIRFAWEDVLKMKDGMEEAQFALMKKILGEECVLTLGTAEDKIFVGFGKDAVEMLRNRLETPGAEDGTLIRGRVSVRRVLGYVLAVQEAYLSVIQDVNGWREQMADMSDQERDKLLEGLTNFYPAKVMRLLSEILETDAEKDHVTISMSLPAATTIEYVAVGEKGVMKLIGSLRNIYQMIEMRDEDGEGMFW